MLQVAEIQDPAAALDSAVLPVKLTNQSDEPSGRAAGSPQIRQHLLRGIGKASRPPFQLLPAGIPNGLYLLRQHRVIGFSGKAKHAEADVLPAAYLVPGGTGTEIFQLLDQLGDILHGLFHAGIPLQAGQALPQHLQFPVQPGKQVLHQVSAPKGLACIGHSLQGGVFQAAIQPGLGVQVAAGAVVYL